MNCTKNSHIHGYPESLLDASVRVSLADGRIAVFTVTPVGLEGRISLERLVLPPELQEIMDISRLMGFLRNYSLNISGNQVFIYGLSAPVGYPSNVKTSPAVPSDFFE